MKKNKMKIRYTLLASLCILTAIACNKIEKLGNINTDEWRPDVAISLVNTTVTTQDLLENYGEDTEIIVDQNQQLTLVYRSEGYSQEGEELFQLIPDVNFPMNTSPFKLPYPLPAGVRIDYIVAKSGDIKITSINPHLESIGITFSIPESTLNGDIFEKYWELPGAFPAPFENIYPLADYILRPEDDSITFQYDARILSNDSMVAAAFVIDFVEPQFSYAEGFLGNGSFSIPRDTIEVDFFRYFNNDGSVFFEEPRMILTVRNSFGFPVRAQFDVLNAVTKDGTVIPFSSTQLDDGVDFNYPSLTQVGEEKTTIFTIDKDNSNIANIIGQPIVMFDYEADININPDNDTTLVGFVTDSSDFYLDAEIELPLYGRVNGFVVNDTLALELGEYKKVEDVEFKLVVENGFPTDAEIQVYFVDDDFAVIDQLLDPVENALVAAPVGPDGRVTMKERKETFAPINKDRFTNIKNNATQMIISVGMTTINDGTTSVRIYEDYNMDVKLGVIAGLDPDAE